MDNGRNEGKREMRKMWERKRENGVWMDGSEEREVREKKGTKTIGT